METVHVALEQESHGNLVMYHLKDGLDRVFMKEELILIPEDTELPPDFVQTYGENIPFPK